MDFVPITVLALIGARALWLTYLWLGSAILASLISARKGYGERPGLAAGLLLSAIGVVLWLVWPARADSRWKRDGALPRRRGVRRGGGDRDAPGEDGMHEHASHRETPPGSEL